MRYTEHLWTACILSLPSLLWIVLDNSVWFADSSWYAQAAIHLFHTLISSPTAWPSELISTFEIKAPGIAWLGQFFVPLGSLFGSIDLALLFMVFLATALAYSLLYRLIIRITPHNRIIALTICLFAAAAPLMIGLSHLFLIEVFQVNIVLLALLEISSRAGFSARMLTTANIIYAALLIKFTSLSYIALPIATTAITLIVLRRKMSPNTWMEKLSLPSIISSLLLFTICFAWYIRNWHAVWHTAIENTSGRVALYFGTPAPVSEKLFFWGSALKSSFFGISWIFFLTAFAFALAIFLRISRGRTMDQLDRLTLIAGAQIGLVLLIMSFQITEEPRYLLPLLPYFAVILAFTLKEIPEVAQRVYMLLFGISFIVGHGYALNLNLAVAPQHSPWLIPLDTNSSNRDRIREVASASCGASQSTRRIITSPYVERAFDLYALNLASAKDALARSQAQSCFFEDFGWAEDNLDRALARVRRIEPISIVILERSESGASDRFNKVVRAVEEELENCNSVQKKTLPGASNVVIYTPINQQTWRQALSRCVDNHEKGIEANFRRFDGIESSGQTPGNG